MITVKLQLPKVILLLPMAMCLSFMLVSCAPPGNSSDTGTTWEGDSSLVDALNDDLNDLNEEITNHPFFKEQGREDEDIDITTKNNTARQYSLNIPRPWYRRVSNIDHDFDVSVNGNEADVTHTSTIEGVLYVAFDTTVVEKEFKDTATRSAHFERDSLNRWQLNTVTLLDIDLYDTTIANVSINALDIEIVDGSSPGQSWSFTDPGSLLSLEAALPTFAPEDLVRVEVTASNPVAEEGLYVFLHHSGWRDLMYDDGATSGDLVAGDGVFTRTYTIGNNTGLHFAFVDVLSAPTLDEMSEPDNYRSAAWGLPYHITNPNQSPNMAQLMVFINNFSLFWSPDTVDLGLNGIPYLKGKEDTGVFFGRRMQERKHLRQIEVDVSNNQALIQTVAHFRGSMGIDSDLTGPYLGGVIPKTIAFDEAKVRTAQLEYSNGRWELASLSPGKFMPPDEVSGLPNSPFSFGAIRVSKGDEIIWQCSNLEDNLTWDSGYPELHPNEEIKIEVQASGTEEFYLFLRYGFFARDLMADDGTLGDSTADDGWYTRTLTVGNNYGYHNAALDIISAQNFVYADPGEYQSIGASFIYKVTRP